MIFAVQQGGGRLSRHSLEFPTVFADDVPVLTMNEVNLVRSFFVFVDAMYECHVNFIVHAETPPDGI